MNPMSLILAKVLSNCTLTSDNICRLFRGLLAVESAAFTLSTLLKPLESSPGTEIPAHPSSRQCLHEME